MATDHIRYDILAQEALRGVVRTVLADVAKNGLPGDHHFKITFTTTAPGVRLSERMRGQYPEVMTVILQHQFWDLTVDDDAFEVGLSFGGVPERLAVPFDWIEYGIARPLPAWRRAQRRRQVSWRPSSPASARAILLIVMLPPLLHTQPWLQVRRELSVGFPTFNDCCLSGIRQLVRSVNGVDRNGHWQC